MAFPTTGILDSFNRADESPLGTASSGDTWNGPIDGTSAELQVVSNQVTSAAADAGLDTQYLNGAYGPAAEAYITWSTLDVQLADVLVIYLRGASFGGASFNAYALQVLPTFNTLQVLRFDAGASTQLGATISQTPASGDAFGISASGSTLTVFYKASGGSWASKGTRTDSTYTAAGKVGLELSRAAASISAWDDLGGGTTATPPSQQQMTLTTLFRQAMQRRVVEKRRMPLQGAEGHPTFVKAPLSDAGTASLTMRRPLLGPRPPTQVTAAPTLRQQTIVTRLRVDHRRRTEVRRFPKQWYEPATTRITGFAAGIIALNERGIGPDPPSVVKANVPLFLQTTRVALVAVRTRRNDVPIGPRGTVSWVAAPVVVGAPLPVVTTLRVVCVAVRARQLPQYRAARTYLLTPIPFVLLQPSAQPIETTIGVALQAVARRIKNQNLQPHWKLSSPATLSTGPPPTPIRVTLAAVESRATIGHRRVRSLLQPPFFYPATSAIRVSLTRIRPRPRRALLAPPTVLQVFQAEAVQDRVTVSLAAQPRRHAARPRLSPPTVLQTFQGPRVTVARVRPRPTTRFLRPAIIPPLPPAPPTEVVDRVSVTLAAATRRRYRSFLSKPSVLQTFEGPFVALARIRPRPTISVLSPPFFYPATSQILTKLVRTRPPRFRASLDPPTTLQEFAAGPVEDRVSVTVASQPRRHSARSSLFPPTALQTFPGAKVALTRTRPRPTRKFVAPPTAVLPLPTQQMQTITVKLAGRTRSEAGRRAPHLRLEPPVVVLSPPSLRQQTPLVVLSAQYRRSTDRRRFPQQWQQPATTKTNGSPATTLWLADRALGPRAPRVIGALPTQQQQTLSSRLVAARTRVEVQRRVGRRRLAPPTVVLAPPTLRQQTVQVVLAGRTRVEVTRRAPHWRLRGPVVVRPLPSLRAQTVQVTLAWWRRLEDLRRGPRSRLSPPTVTKPPPTQRQQTISTLLVAVRARVELQRREPISTLRPPTTLAPPTPPTPPTGAVGHGGSGFPPARIMRLLDQVEERGLESLDDEEVALLMLNGYL